MPKWVEDCVAKLKQKGIPNDKAWAICQAEYKKQQEGEKEKPEKEEKKD